LHGTGSAGGGGGDVGISVGGIGEVKGRRERGEAEGGEEGSGKGGWGVQGSNPPLSPFTPPIFHFSIPFSTV